MNIFCKTFYIYIIYITTTLNILHSIICYSYQTESESVVYFQFFYVLFSSMIKLPYAIGFKMPRLIYFSLMHP